jgi:type I restriction enzyme S subunit
MEKVKILKAVDIINDSVSEYEGERPFLSTGDLNLSTITNLELHTFSEKPSRANQNVSSGDLILARMQGTVKVKLINNEDENIIVSTGFLVLRPKINADSKYLFHLLKSSNFQNDKDKLCTGATQKAINNSNFEKLEIPLPNLATQQRIAAILDQADAIIQNNRAIVQKYDALTQSLFLDMFGDPVKNEKGWEKRKLNDFLEILVDVGSNGGNDWVSANIKMKDEEDYALMIRTINLNKNDFENNLKYVSEETYNLFKKTKVYGGEIIMNKIGSAGEFWLMPYLNRPVSLGLNQLMMTFKNLDKFYFYFYFSTNYGKKLINSKLNGATTKSITKTALRDLDILYPPMELQNQFAERVAMIEAQKQQAQLELAKSEELFQSLLQRAFKGELS